MNKQKVLDSIYNIQKNLESLESSLFAIKVKDSKHEGHLKHAKSYLVGIAAIMKNGISELREELEHDRYNELSVSSTEKFLKINSPNEESKEEIKKTLNLRQKLVNNANKAKKTINPDTK